MTEQSFLKPNKRADLRFRRKKNLGVKENMADMCPLLRLDWRGGFGK